MSCKQAALFIYSFIFFSFAGPLPLCFLLEVQQATSNVSRPGFYAVFFSFRCKCAVKVRSLSEHSVLSYLSEVASVSV